jgi:hypothetical protein
MHSWLDVMAGLIVPVLVALLVYVAERTVERRTITRAILAEIGTLLEITSGHHRWWRKVQGDREKFHALIPFSTPMYDAQASHIGMLKGGRVADVVAFYRWIKFLNSLQQTRTAYTDRNDPAFAKAYESALFKFLNRFSAKFTGTAKRTSRA